MELYNFLRILATYMVQIRIIPALEEAPPWLQLSNNKKCLARTGKALIGTFYRGGARLNLTRQHGELHSCSLDGEEAVFDEWIEQFKYIFTL